MMEQQVNYPCETLIAFPQVDRHDPESDIETAGTKLCDLARKNSKQGDKPSP